MAALSNDQLAQALIIGWGFSSTIQGVTGFGVPVAVSAPLLIMLGVPPIRAAAMSLVGHGWAVTFGSLGSSYYTLQLVTGIDEAVLAPHMALLFLPVTIASGIARRAHPGRPSSRVAKPAAGRRRGQHHGRRVVWARAGRRTPGRDAGRWHARHRGARGPRLAHPCSWVRGGDETVTMAAPAEGIAMPPLLAFMPYFVLDCPQLRRAGGSGEERPSAACGWPSTTPASRRDRASPSPPPTTTRPSGCWHTPRPSSSSRRR